MENVLVVLVLLGMALFFLGLRYLSLLSGRKRAEAMARVAQGRAWGFTARDDSWVNRFSGPPFESGRARRAQNIVTGTHDGRKFVAFDYRHTVTELRGIGKLTSVTYDYSIVAISTQVVLPRLEVTPEGMLSRMVGRLTGSDIEFESEAFNRAFTVECADRKFATDVIHPQMMEHLLTMPMLAWTLRNGSLMLVGAGQHNLRQLDGRLAIIDGILDRIPKYVWDQVDGT